MCAKRVVHRPSWRQDAISLLHSMPCVKFDPTIYSYNASISACGWADADFRLYLVGNWLTWSLHVTPNFFFFFMSVFTLFFSTVNDVQRCTPGRAWRFSATQSAGHWATTLGRSGGNVVAMGFAALPTTSARCPAAGFGELHGTPWLRWWSPGSP